MSEPLSRLFAYPVFPQQPPEGGAVTITAEVEAALDEAYRRAEASRGRTVSLILEEDTGSSEVREALIAIAFGEETSAQSAADLLAHRLGGSMDRRSTAGLLVISVHGVGANREVELWIFPRHAAFRFSGRADAEGIELLDDLFSFSSAVRKSAFFRGSDGDGFITGRVVDFQAHGADRYVADFWVQRFLQARLEMTGEEGTLLFGKAVKQALDGLRGDVAAQHELAAALGSVRDGPRRLSLRSFVDEHLSGAAAEAVMARAPDPQAADAVFDFDPRRLAEMIGFHVFRLDTGVTVSAPLEAVGESVAITDDAGRLLLETRGEVTAQTVRSRSG